jgi:hypothetical protein
MQAWEIAENNPWNAEHLFRAAKFSNVRSLTLFIDSNHGGATTRVNYLALKGIFTPLKSEPIVAMYELRPVPGIFTRSALTRLCISNSRSHDYL